MVKVYKYEYSPSSLIDEIKQNVEHLETDQCFDFCNFLKDEYGINAIEELPNGDVALGLNDEDIQKIKLLENKDLILILHNIHKIKGCYYCNCFITCNYFITNNIGEKEIFFVTGQTYDHREFNWKCEELKEYCKMKYLTWDELMKDAFNDLYKDVNEVITMGFADDVERKIKCAVIELDSHYDEEEFKQKTLNNIFSNERWKKYFLDGSKNLATSITNHAKEICSKENWEYLWNDDKPSCWFEINDDEEVIDCFNVDDYQVLQPSDILINLSENTPTYFELRAQYKYIMSYFKYSVCLIGTNEEYMKNKEEFNKFVDETIEKTRQDIIQQRNSIRECKK